MLSGIKQYINIIVGAIVLAFLAYVKYLRASNIEQKENIERLKKEINVRKEVSKDDLKKAIFDASQKARAKELKKTEITLDKIEKEIRRNEENLNGEHASNDNFTTSRV